MNESPDGLFMYFYLFSWCQPVAPNFANDELEEFKGHRIYKITLGAFYSKKVYICVSISSCKGIFLFCFIIQLCLPGQSIEGGNFNTCSVFSFSFRWKMRQNTDCRRRSKKVRKPFTAVNHFEVVF